MKTRSLLQVGIMVAGLALAAAANPVSIQFMASGASTPGGTPYYPYQIQVTDGTNVNNYIVACDDFFDHVAVGETYTGWVSSYTDLSHTLYNGGQATPDTQYEELAWLFSNLDKVPPGPDLNPQNAAINFAMWDLFAAGAPALNSDGTLASPSNTGVVNGPDSSAFWLQAAATEAANNFAGFDFTGYRIFSPVNSDGTPWTASDRPQEFISGPTVPEPASLALLGTGLLGLAFLFRRRLQDGSGVDVQA